MNDKPLNLSMETWAVMLILIGCAMELTCHFFNVNAEVGAGIVGAGTMAFTASVKNQHDTIATGSNPVVINRTESDQKKGS